MKIAGLCLVAALMLGCEKEPATTDVTPAPSTPDVTTGDGTAVPEAGQAAARDTADQTGAAATEASAEAQTLLDQTMDYIKENKWDMAEQSLQKLEAMRSTLPAEWGPRIDQARQAFNTGKATMGGGNVPPMPK